MLRSLASTLPRQLLSMVFDYVALKDVLRLGRVCKRWRRVARAHPTFWQDLQMWGIKKKDLAFFSARLSSTKKPGVRIVVLLTDYEGSTHQAARKSILEAITANLARISYLHLDFFPALAEEAFFALRDPAPFLEELILGCMFLGANTARCLPHSLLAGSSPSLARVQLVGLLPPLQPSRAFAQVKRLQYTVTEQAYLSTNLFEHFPALQVLDIFSNGACDGDTLISHFKKAHELTSLAIQSDKDDLHALFLACPRLLSIPTIHFTLQNRVLDLLARRLPGPLGLEVDASTFFTVTSHSRGWRRTCKITSPGLPRRPYLAGTDFYSCKPIAHRITTLALDMGPGATCYRIASLIGALPACEMLKISVDRFLYALERHRGDPIPLPSLTKVVIRPRGGELSVAVRAQMLAWFLRDLIGRQAPRLPLELAGVSLEGDYTPLEADYIFLADVLL